MKIVIQKSPAEHPNGENILKDCYIRYMSSLEEQMEFIDNAINESSKIIDITKSKL